MDFMSQAYSAVSRAVTQNCFEEMQFKLNDNERVDQSVEGSDTDDELICWRLYRFSNFLLQQTIHSTQTETLISRTPLQYKFFLMKS